MTSWSARATVMAPEIEDEDDEPYDPEAERRELERFRFRHRIAHLSASKNWPRLFELVEQSGFLADQADYFGGFQHPGEDVESHVLPAAITTQDWERFVRFASVAANLRALSEDLVDPEVLAALARSGRDALALDLAARLTSPVRRAEARAIIAASCGKCHPVFGSLLREIAEDLQGVDEEALAAHPSSLIAVARRLGPELDTLWPVCLERLPARIAFAVWQGVAQAWMDRGDARHPDLWRALAGIHDPALILEMMESLAGMEPENPWEILGRVRLLFGREDEARRRAFASFLARLSRTRLEEALAAWDLWTHDEEVPWTAELVETGGGLIVRLEAHRLEALYAEITDVTARAALRVVELEAHPSDARAEAALTAVGTIPDGPNRLHWTLRYVAARPPLPRKEIRRQVGASAAYLDELRYEAPAGDLCRFLDLVARFRPEELKTSLESVVWSPGSRPDMLLTLAGKTTREEVADLLLDKAERYAAAVSTNEAEGFQLRKELLLQTTCRLCTLRQTDSDLQRVVGRLLPDEEDELRATLAAELAGAEALEPNRPKLSLTVAEGIHDRRRHLLALLESAPPGETPADLLTARSLYASVARIDSARDEVQGLATLLNLPLDFKDLAEKQIQAIRDPGIRLRSLLRLAWHSLAFQESFYGGRADRSAVVEVVRAGLSIDTDAWLVSSTPDLAALGVQIGGARARDELQEAIRQLAGMASVPWQDREDALERLLAMIPRAFPSGSSKDTRSAVEVLEMVGRLPLQTGAALDEVRHHWHTLLPRAVAALDRLPGGAFAPVRHAFQTGLAFPVRSEQRPLLELCLLDPEERVREVESRLGAPDLNPSAVVYLLMSRRPKAALDALCRMPDGPEKDGLALRLIRNGWVRPGEAPALLERITDPDQFRRAKLLASPAHYDDLAKLVVTEDVDPAATENEPLVRALWTFSSAEALEALAKGVPAALKAGGRARGEAALRLWLHAFFSPRLGTFQQDRAQLVESVTMALERSLELAPSPATVR